MPALVDSYVIAPPPRPAIAVADSDKTFPVHRIWCVGRNYEEHIREMGHDVRAPPFFFAKPADAIVPDGASVPYPPLTKDMHHEVELVVALKSGGLNNPTDKALDHVYGYAVGIDPTPRAPRRHRPPPPRPAARRAQEGAPVGGRQVVRSFRALLGDPARGQDWSSR